MATKIISKEEAEGMELMPFGRKHPVRILIEALKPGELLIIDRADFVWKGKTPGIICRAVSKITRAKFKVLNQRYRKGWVVMRLE
jgi:hypothetical protein